MKFGRFFASLLWRLLRSTSSLLISYGVSLVAKDPRWIALAPIIQAVAKYMRDKFGLINIPI